MFSAFHSFTFIDNQNVVRSEDREQPMSDNDHRFILYKFIYRILHSDFTLRIEGDRRLIENNDGRIFENCPGWASKTRWESP